MAEITPSGAQSVATATVTLSAAQVLAIFTTPVVIIPAPSAGLAIYPVTLVCNYIFNSVAYTDGGGNIQLKVGTATYGVFASAGFWDQALSTVRAITSASFGTAAASAMNGGAVTLSQSAANPTLGNGRVAVTVAYVVVPVS